jgi:hypothetical protein
MTSDELKALIAQESKHLDALYGEMNHRTKDLARTAQLTEEIGELNNVVLSSLKLQRPDKDTLVEFFQ